MSVLKKMLDLRKLKIPAIRIIMKLLNSVMICLEAIVIVALASHKGKRGYKNARPVPEPWRPLRNPQVTKGMSNR